MKKNDFLFKLNDVHKEEWLPLKQMASTKTTVSNKREGSN